MCLTVNCMFYPKTFKCIVFENTKLAQSCLSASDSDQAKGHSRLSPMALGMEGVGISRGPFYSVEMNSKICTQVGPEFFPKFVETKALRGKITGSRSHNQPKARKRTKTSTF